MNENIRFLLNLQMIADEVIVKIPDVQFYTGEDRRSLEGICFYRPGMEMVSQCAYVVEGDRLKELPVSENHCSLILLGEVPEA
ncbi:MAG: hypothetical protein ACOX8E_08040 [Ruminococcus sp.]|jgi:hypothetical protein